MEAPYTKKELIAMSAEEIFKIPKKSPRLYPYCLVGLHIDEVRQRVKEWFPIKVEILISGKDGCAMDFNTVYYYCEVDENNMMKKVFPAFDYDD
jgi:hypothetical protein